MLRMAGNRGDWYCSQELEATPTRGTTIGTTEAECEFVDYFARWRRELRAAQDELDECRCKLLLSVTTKISRNKLVSAMDDGPIESRVMLSPRNKIPIQLLQRSHNKESGPTKEEAEWSHVKLEISGIIGGG